ncbi:hypothetical protein DAPPUDRAFT_245621 [Daphnia pulex]|uniref:Reverse transcriptase RNase H-like domain-containing protein n=1 Tax=Daphnia pulex TaxID=6669 RepID=E9GNP8_DAPPU|nr:hypothetical protein DAPPUDRAFT_245621 [Daphnia pulex]|eukprot:EFX78922.1 hypothetical protein DAPPUDRAFT_245621 [Daphnia pulex]
MGGTSSIMFSKSKEEHLANLGSIFDLLKEADLNLASRNDDKFEIISDHRPLQWLKAHKDEKNRLGRWAIELAAVNVRFVVTSRLTPRRLDHRATPPSHPVLHRAAGSSSHATAISPSHGRVPPDHHRPLRPRLVPAAAAY